LGPTPTSDSSHAFHLQTPEELQIEFSPFILDGLERRLDARCLDAGQTARPDGLLNGLHIRVSNLIPRGKPLLQTGEGSGAVDV
jgi:hypothetical protein